MNTFYEFFAGGGMARAGLGPEWKCLFSNDFDHKKGVTYVKNWGKETLEISDVRSIEQKNLPAYADLIWASFPCQDLSLAGGGAGLKGDRSGTFWPFWNLIENLGENGRKPKIVILENVCGTLTSHNGKDFSAICEVLNRAKYKFGACIVDAAYFLPHSRPRLFMIAVSDEIEIPMKLVNQGGGSVFHPKALLKAHSQLVKNVVENWVWWNLPMPDKRQDSLADLIEERPGSVEWHTKSQTDQLLRMMSPLNLEKVKIAQAKKKKQVGTIYKRTRKDINGERVQRAEVRFDNIAGCLRTPAGGSSRQLIMVVEGDSIRSRLISTRETARLMGLPDSYILPSKYNEAYHLTGDGVVVPVVRHIAKWILEPILKKHSIGKLKAA
jgi:DNA (cytosine-5)-methyltransferase 1